MMHPRLPATLLALVLSACASHEGPATSSDPTPEPQRADVKVAVASVQLIQDCPDPPDPPPAAGPTPAAVPPPAAAQPAPAMPAPAANMDVPPGVTAQSMQRPPAGDVAAGKMSPGAAMPGTGGWSPPCSQSTVQLSLSNTGEATGQLRIVEMRLLDASSKRSVSKVGARKPQLWNEEIGYRTWDERVAPGQTLRVSYRIGEPDRVAPNGSSAPEGKPYILEIDVAVDGRTQTVRSAEFVREPIHMIVT